MDKELIKILFALLRFEISGAELCESDKNLITEEVLPALYKLSKKHDLAHLVGDALDKNGLLVDGSEAKKRFLQERNMAVYRYEQLRYELECICTTFEEAKIPFIPLKGAVIRQYYPEPWMRTSCDIDILVEEENLLKAISVLKETLKYTTDEKKSSHDVSLFALSGVHLELHFNLTEGDKYAKEVLSKIWQYALSMQTSSYQMLLKEETFYLYHIVHMVKHFEYGGCGIKPFVDLWLLKMRGFGNDKCEFLLSKQKLLTFEKAAWKLSKIWLAEEEMDSISAQMQDYVLGGGVYGTVENRVLTQQVKKGGKFKYILSRIFLPYKDLAIKYPFLKKAPILYPFYMVKRCFNLLFNKQIKKQSSFELEKVGNVNEGQRKQQEKLLSNLGLR